MILLIMLFILVMAAVVIMEKVSVRVFDYSILESPIAIMVLMIIVLILSGEII